MPTTVEDWDIPDGVRRGAGGSFVMPLAERKARELLAAEAGALPA
jgi:hypothetical protein